MVRYIGKRIALGLLSILLLVTAAFFLTRCMPGSPFSTGNVSEEVLDKIEEEYGLNEPVFVQYKTYVENLLKGDFGMSYKKTGLKVTDVIVMAWKPTAVIGGLATLLAFLGGTLLGIWYVYTKKEVVKQGILFFSILGTSVPNFVLAAMLALLFGILFQLLPISGLISWQSYILPVAALSVYPMSVVTRLAGSALETELSKEYVLLARAKELPEWRILLDHVLRNAWTPVLNYIGPASAFLLTGSFVVESCFNIPGLGREFVNSITNRDYTMILGLTVFMGIVVIVVNLLVDLLCAWLDPKVLKSYEGGNGHER